jgi:carboxymethylenebutenolidase
MPEIITLTSPADGFRFPAYHAAPNGQPRRAGLVVLHALWGVTPPIRALCDDFAAEGYEVVAIDSLDPPVSLMGFCFGGTAAWIAAAKCSGLSAVSCFYGGLIAQHRALQPRCPAILHFGRKDELIPPEEVEAIAAAHPDLPIWLYDAGHAFVAPSGYHKDSATLAMLRTRQLFHRAAGAKEVGA